MTWLIVIAGLVGIVFIHELGHFGVAMLVGMRPRSFYIGFPPAVVKVRRRGIEYGIGMIPLGGYVRLPGMHRPAVRDLQMLFGPAIEEEASLAPSVLAVRRAVGAEDYKTARAACLGLEHDVANANLSTRARRSAERALRDVEEGTAPDAYWRAPTWKRVAVIAAGPLANVLAAFVILFVVYATSGVPSGPPHRQVASVSAGFPAASAGLQAGDKVIAVDGQPTATFAAVSRLIRASKGAPIAVTVLRGQREVRLGPASTVFDKESGRWIWGFAPSVDVKSVPVGRSARNAVTDLGDITTGTFGGLGSLVHGQSRAQLTTVVGLGSFSAAALRVSVAWYFQLLALFSMSLALHNLLPLLPLDGGHILFSLIEGVRRRAVAREVYERASMVGLALILLVMVIAAENDAHRFFG